MRCAIIIACLTAITACKARRPDTASTKTPDVSSLFPGTGPLGENCWNNPTSEPCQPHRFLPAMPCYDLFNVWQERDDSGQLTGKFRLPQVSAVDELMRGYQQPAGYTTFGGQLLSTPTNNPRNLPRLGTYRTMARYYTRNQLDRRILNMVLGAGVSRDQRRYTPVAYVMPHNIAYRRASGSRSVKSWYITYVPYFDPRIEAELRYGLLFPENFFNDAEHESRLRLSEMCRPGVSTEAGSIAEGQGIDGHLSQLAEAAQAARRANPVTDGAAYVRIAGSNSNGIRLTGEDETCDLRDEACKQAADEAQGSNAVLGFKVSPDASTSTLVIMPESTDTTAPVDGFLSLSADGVMRVSAEIGLSP